MRNEALPFRLAFEKYCRRHSKANRIYKHTLQFGRNEPFLSNVKALDKDGKA